MKYNPNCEAFDGRKWRPARIDRRTGCSMNYPQGGVYITWLDLTGVEYESKGGWKPLNWIRNHDDLTKIPQWGY